MIIAEGHYTEEGIIERLAKCMHIVQSSRTHCFTLVPTGIF